MESQGVVDGCDVFKVDCIRDLQTFHAVSVAPFLEMHLESTTAPVAEVSANFAFVFDSQSMQLVEPVGNRLAIPTQGKIFGVVNGSISLLTLRRRFLVFFNFFVASCLFLSNQVHRIVDNTCQILPKSADAIFQHSQTFLSLLVFFLILLSSSLFLFRVMNSLLLRQFHVFLTHEVTDEGFIRDE